MGLLRPNEIVYTKEGAGVLLKHNDDHTVQVWQTHGEKKNLESSGVRDLWEELKRVAEEATANVRREADEAREKLGLEMVARIKR
jgi:hypothetical protein